MKRVKKLFSCLFFVSLLVFSMSFFAFAEDRNPVDAESVLTDSNTNLTENAGQTIQVTFTLLGDKVHDAVDENSFHTFSMGTLQTWVATKTYSVNADSSVKDLLEYVLKENGMQCSNPSGNYVESITKGNVTLGEFDNGTYSGWMYTLNGKHPSVSVEDQLLQDGDIVVFHYTDHYLYEEGNNKNDEVQAAGLVYENIGNIGTVSYTSTCQNAIKAARSAYNALTDAQKSLVTKEQYAVLCAAEQKYESLEAAYIKQNTPSKAKLVSVRKNSSRNAKITWKKVSGATGYQVFMSTKKTSGYKKIATIKSAKTLSYLKKKLTRKKTYYFKVRAYRSVGNTVFYGSCSNIKGLKIK